MNSLQLTLQADQVTLHIIPPPPPPPSFPAPQVLLLLCERRKLRNLRLRSHLLITLVTVETREAHTRMREYLNFEIKTPNRDIQIHNFLHTKRFQSYIYISQQWSWPPRTSPRPAFPPRLKPVAAARRRPKTATQSRSGSSRTS